MRIGIFIDGLTQLTNWQQRIIDRIVKNPNLDLALLIANSNESVKTNLYTLSTAERPQSWGLSGFILKAQYRLEGQKLFKRKHVVSFDEFLPQLSKINKINLKTNTQRGNWVYTSEELKQIENAGLDLIINLSSFMLKGEIVNISKYGSWALMHKDSAEVTNYPIGFAEVLYKKSVIGCSLLQLGQKEQENKVLGAAYFNLHWSMYETETLVTEGGVALLFKNLHLLQNGKLVVHTKPSYTLEKLEVPKLAATLNYLLFFYIGFADKLVEKFLASVLKKRHECWTVFTGEKGFYKNITTQPTPFKMPNDEFWADPFLFEHKEVTYVFFENYSYKTNKGIISCGILKDDQLTQVVDVLDKEYHLSFPYMFEEDGEIYMMPETSANKRLEIYKAVDFPTKWELERTAFDGEMIADAFFHTDKDQQKWLFMNKQMATTAPLNSELFIYKVDSFRLNSIQAHKQNPVLIDARVARNGGSIFEHEGDFFRPSQRNVDGIYGRALNINKVEKLTLEEYQEKTVHIIKPSFDKKLIGLHHLHQLNGKFVFDAAYKRK